MKKIFALIAILFAFTPVQARNHKDTALKAMSYNMRVGTAKDGDNAWENRCPATAAMLEEVAPDVFGVQEALDFQLKYITDNCPQYECIGVGREDGKSKGEHMSVFYNKDRFKMLKWGTYWLSETPDVPSKGWDAKCKRTATWVLLKDRQSGKKFWFVNTHLDHIGKEARLKGLALIVDNIKAMNPKGYPMVLTGDFNVTPDDPCLVDLDKIMSSARKVAVNTDTKPSFTGWGEPRKIIDYVYISGFAVCTDFKVIDKQYAGIPYISDHYPVTAILKY